jgi:hypothetical protein
MEIMEIAYSERFRNFKKITPSINCMAIFYTTIENLFSVERD